MLKRPLIAIGLLIAGSATAAAQAPGLGCEATDTRSAFVFTGEIAGNRDYVQEMPPGWLFWMEGNPFGWDIRIYSNDPNNPPGVDLTAVTPPFNGPNPRDVYGWHFRNADNTGTNMGDVNAPQHLRLFTFSPALIGTGGFRPPEGNVFPEPDPDDGRGWLRIDDFGLADLEPGQQARMVYIRFTVCLTYPVAYDPPPPEPLTFEPEDIERIRACGLDESLAPLAYVQPPTLELDFDFDQAWDFVVPIERVSDGKRGIAICRAGTWLHIIGLEGDIGELGPGYFESMDWWYAEPRGPIGQGAGQGAPPIPAGDTLTIGIEGASSVLIYWDGETFRSYWQGD